ncbi:Myelin protein zero-like protein 3, partial [Sciurus carolinensis]|nr:Myelin protein zero-like protein 3 [Sciurus carolinensis]
VHIVLSLEINADAHVRGYVGEKIKLKCTFKSTSDVTDKLTIDWTYRPPSSSRTESIFHYQSFQYPTTAGTFRDRISWVGNVYKGDASISISNPTLKDNGTFSCAVKNPPDVHHNIPLTELTVTERGKLIATSLLQCSVQGSLKSKAIYLCNPFGSLDHCDKVIFLLS